jgi:hypothetical protein
MTKFRYSLSGESHSMQTYCSSKFADFLSEHACFCVGMMKFIYFPYGHNQCGIHMDASEGFLS